MFALMSLELEDAAANDHRGTRDDASSRRIDGSINDCLTPDEEISDEEDSSSGDSSSGDSDETSTSVSFERIWLVGLCQT